MSQEIGEKYEELDEKLDLIVKFVSENKNAIGNLTEKMTDLQSQIDLHRSFMERIVGMLEHDRLQINELRRDIGQIVKALEIYGVLERDTQDV